MSLIRILPLLSFVLNCSGALNDTSAFVIANCRLWMRSVKAELPKKQSRVYIVSASSPMGALMNPFISSISLAKWAIYAESTGSLQMSRTSPVIFFSATLPSRSVISTSASAMFTALHEGSRHNTSLPAAFFTTAFLAWWSWPKKRMSKPSTFFAVFSVSSSV